MKTKTEYSLYIGLKESDMVTNIPMNRALRVINRNLLAHGITGFNAHKIEGFWESKGESSLLVNFINTFGIQKRVLYHAIASIKKDLNQETILLKQNPVRHDFI